MNVLSLFDGISCGRVALERAEVCVDNYFASEIDKNAIKVAQHNYPDTVQIGDVTKVKGIDLPNIDLLMGGSPCQGFSFSGKQLNFNDPRSALFFEFVRLKKEVNPKWFLLENVVMKQEYQDVISEHLNVRPLKLNSRLTSAQNRVRLYWTNIPITEPTDSGIKLSDIIEYTDMENPAAVRGRKLNKGTILGRRLDARGERKGLRQKHPDNTMSGSQSHEHGKEQLLDDGGQGYCFDTFGTRAIPRCFQQKTTF